MFDDVYAEGSFRIGFGGKRHTQICALGSFRIVELM